MTRAEGRWIRTAGLPRWQAASQHGRKRSQQCSHEDWLTSSVCRPHAADVVSINADQQRLPLIAITILAGSCRPTGVGAG